MLSSLVIYSILAIFTSFVIALLLGPRLITSLKRLQGEGQPIREDGPESHHTKKGTPTMGGLLIIIASTLGQIIWCDFTNPYIWILNATMFIYGFLGFIDDYRKLRYRNSKGISGKGKLLYQFMAGGLIAYAIMVVNTYITGSDTFLHKVYILPFTCSSYCTIFSVALWFFLIFSAFVIVGSSNAVNLTDGLDGLSITPIIMCLVFFTLVSGGWIGQSLWSLEIGQNPKIVELSLYCSCLIGASLGFLWFNTSPAKVFMGDIGSLSLGAVLGVLSIILNLELFFVIIGGLFVLEALSVILQVGSFKLRKKRIFRMAPIHHHFEKLGWSENTVVLRFWILSGLCFLLGILALQ